MTEELPTPPTDLPGDLIETLNDYGPDRLRNVSEYAEALAEYKARVARLAGQPDGEVDTPDDFPEDVPSKATITIKEINDNRYYYWQWREGEKIKSKYKGPVSPSD